jgi:Tol biopolymer transport system component
MPRVFRYKGGFLVAVAAFLAIVNATAGEAPSGPQLAISVSAGEPDTQGGGFEVITTGPSGQNPQRLIRSPGTPIEDSLSWSADGTRLAFGVSGVKSTVSKRFGIGSPVPVVGVAEAEDGSVRVFPRAFLNAGEPVISPDGRSVAFPRVKRVKSAARKDHSSFKTSIWVLHLGNGRLRRLTRWRQPGLLQPISYSPDGSALIVMPFDGRGHRIVAIDLRSRRKHRLASLGADDWQPTYSPDATRLAFVRLLYLGRSMLPPARPVSELMVARADGTRVKLLLRKRGYISSPSWDPSGTRLAFTRDSPIRLVGTREPRQPGNKAMEINADGTCLTRVFQDPEATVHGAAWQPGTGRAAGRIPC